MPNLLKLVIASPGIVCLKFLMFQRLRSENVLSSTCIDALIITGLLRQELLLNWILNITILR